MKWIAAIVANMRQSPSNHAELISQALMGEGIVLLQTEDRFSLVQTPDGYRGWVLSEDLIDQSASGPVNGFTTKALNHLYAKPDILCGPYCTLPFGIQLQICKEESMGWAEVKLITGLKLYIQMGNLSRGDPMKKSTLASWSHQFLGLPYTWGGRSSFGYDCSGFIQMLYAQMGIHLPRDAKDQIQSESLREIAISQMGAGDLIFWGQSKDQIQHVGLYLGNQQFIHASNRERQPWLRISSLEDEAWKGDGSLIYPYREYRQPIDLM